MKLSLADLVEGISWWLQKTKWPRDFHNEVYYNLYDLKKSGLADSWWDRTVDRLQEWHATRPLPVDEIRKRGFEVLPRLQEMYLDLCAKSQDELFFLDFRWERIMGFYSLLGDIEGVGSPVFSSKLILYFLNCLSLWIIRLQVLMIIRFFGSQCVKHGATLVKKQKPRKYC